MQKICVLCEGGTGLLNTSKIRMNFSFQCGNNLVAADASSHIDQWLKVTVIYNTTVIFTAASQQNREESRHS
jgi:hypothetical protein